MACHTISESARITGKSRRTIQRYVKSGKLSAKSGINGNPSIDTSELIRVFGELSHQEEHSLSHPVTMTNYEDIADMISKAIIDSNKPLHDKINSLTEEIKQLTHRLNSPTEEPVMIAKKKIENPPLKKKEKKTNYLDDIPTFGKNK